MLAYMLSQFLWLTWIILDAFLLYSMFPDLKVMELFQRLQKAWLGIATLMSVFITANILLIFMKRYSLKNQLLFMFALVLLHFALAGALYINTASIPPVWSKMTAVWIIFMYFFDITPPLFVFCSLLKTMPKPRTARNLIQLHNYDRFVGILLMLQVINACWFGAMVYVTQYTTILRNDRNYLSMGGPFAFSFVFHSIVSCVLNHHIRYMLSLGAQLETAKTVSARRSVVDKRKDLPFIKTDLPFGRDGPDSESVLLPNSAYTNSASTPKPFSDWDEISVTSDSEYRTGPPFLSTWSEGPGFTIAQESPITMVEKPAIPFQTLRVVEGKEMGNRIAKSTSASKRERKDPYKAFRVEPKRIETPSALARLDVPVDRKGKGSAHLRVDTHLSTLTPADNSPGLSPLQGYKSLERPRSTYSTLFEATKERGSMNLHL
jgi:hypothetical protein